MAFIPNTTTPTPFLPVRPLPPSLCPRTIPHPSRTQPPTCTMQTNEPSPTLPSIPPPPPKVASRDAMQFFRHREGTWDSWRVTHHLAFKRSESGESRIKMKCLSTSDPRIIDLCRSHDIDPQLCQGGCHVTWKATLAWDQEGENHQGETVFALVGDAGAEGREGRMLRDRGYAEVVPIVGKYWLDEQDDLNLQTGYDGGEVVERFSFDGRDVVNRVSTVRRFGGFSTATFATESRVTGENEIGTRGSAEDTAGEDVIALVNRLLLHGSGSSTADADGSEVGGAAAQGFRGGRGRWGTVNSGQRPSANSAFGSGFSSTKQETGGNGAGVSDEVMEAARKAGVDLDKIPPSMRADFVDSFRKRGGQ
eukprot:GFKZ01014590.1.p1 GENE.GFKZ01014590.1~~GFKZ01014590.1.p1  ORF type:complete len:364 (+),score=30.17 GFKZ01014590.1:284-1375(+)